MTRSQIAIAHVALGAVLLAPGTTVAQPVQSASLTPASYATINFAPVPFAVGEELVYKVTFGGISAGKARMHVAGIENVRGRPAYHLVFAIDGGIPLFRVRDRFESWIDVETLASLRHRQEISEGRYKRKTTYDIFPETQQYRKNDGELQPSVSDPLDDGSFIYAVRAAGIRVGETRTDDRYFRPDRNPVVLAGVGEERVKVDAGTFDATIVRPKIKANGIFSENGDARIWFSADDRRIPVQVKSRFAKFNLTLTLQSVTPGDPASHRPLVVAALNER